MLRSSQGGSVFETLGRIWSQLANVRTAGRRVRAAIVRQPAVNPVKARISELCLRADAHGIDALTARQQLVVHAWSARGIIGNGGFSYLLEGTHPLGPVAEGFRTLGFNEAAAACERVIAKIAAQQAFGEPARRAAAIGAGGDVPSVAFEAEDDAVFEVGWDALEAAIGDFMRRHGREFPAV